ncbi:MAG TPA: hypothetical protein VIN10_07610 [Bacteroidales bacterium]
MKSNKHSIWMIIGCVLPLLFIFFAPALGINNGFSIFIFLAAMFAIHLIMPMHGHEAHQHGQNNEHQNLNNKTSKTQNHEHNQH